MRIQRTFSLVLLTLVACGDTDADFDGGFDAHRGLDGGPSFDTGPAFDGGPGFDGGPDARRPDAGPERDAGPPVDDAGPRPDVSSPCVTPPCEEPPPWVPPVGEWGVVSTNTMRDIAPPQVDALNVCSGIGMRGVIDAWNGGTYARNLGARGSLLYWGGGHDSYFGNEIYRYDIESRAWLLHSEPFLGDQPRAMPGTYPLGENSDGSPISVHTYNALEWDPVAERFYTFMMSTARCTSNSQSATYAHSYDAMTQTWTRSEERTGAGRRPAATYDESRGIFWLVYEAGPLGSFDPTTQRFTSYGGNWATALEGVTAIYEADDVLVQINVGADTRVRTRDLANPSADAVRITTTGSAPTSRGGGFGWVPERAAFFYYHSGSTLYWLTPGSGSWAWSTEAMGGTPPERADNGSYGRYRYVPSLRSIVGTSDVEDPVRAYRVVN